MPPAHAIAYAIAFLCVLPGCTRPAVAPPKLAACPASTFPVVGACLSDDEAREYCGKAAHPEAGGCVPSKCATDEPMDLASGECVPNLTLRKLASAQHVDLKDASLGCGNPDTMVDVEGDHFACIPRALQCGRGASWTEAACHADPVCPSGTVFDTAGACVSVVHRDRGDDLLDVGTWIRLVVGPDGGKGAPAICGPLVQRPWLAATVAHGNTVLAVQIFLVFPDNSVRDARVTVTAQRQFDPHAAEPPIPLQVAKYLEPVWSALRALRGVANAASASIEVHCTLDGGTDAVPVPHSPKPSERDPQSTGESVKPAS